MLLWHNSPPSKRQTGPTSEAPSDLTMQHTWPDSLYCADVLSTEISINNKGPFFSIAQLKGLVRPWIVTRILVTSHDLQFLSTKHHDLDPKIWVFHYPLHLQYWEPRSAQEDLNNQNHWFHPMFFTSPAASQHESEPCNTEHLINVTVYYVNIYIYIYIVFQLSTW